MLLSGKHGRLVSYDQLVKLYPDVDNYKLAFAQSLYKSGMYQDALKAC